MSSKKSLTDIYKEKTQGKTFFQVLGVALDGISKLLQAKFYLRKCTFVGPLVSVNGKPQLVNRGVLEIHRDSRIWSTINRTKLFVEEGGKMIIGENTHINGAHISASTVVTIGKNVRIGPYSIIVDDDYHDVLDHFSGQPKRAPITIEDNVWIAMDAKVLKGVTLGKGCVVAASSVVTKSFPPYSLVGGIPAKLIRQLQPKS